MFQLNNKISKEILNFNPQTYIIILTKTNKGNKIYDNLSHSERRESCNSNE